MSQNLPNPYAFEEESSGAAARHLNPYDVSPDTTYVDDRVEATRRRYLAHEASVMAIGTLYYLLGSLLALFSLFYLCMAIATLTSSTHDATLDSVPFLVAALVVGMFSGGMFFVGRGIKRLSSWARLVVTILAYIGLFFFPIGTVINGYFLFLLQSDNANVVFSDRYKEVIRLTPHIKYRIDWVSWTILAVVITLIVVLVIVLIPSN